MIYVKHIGQGLPLVLLHGFGFEHSIWSTWLPDLISDYTVYLVDLPGFGHSHWVDWAQFKLQLLVQLPPKFAIVGWSMGGLYATRLAAEHPERVTQVLNITTLPYFVRAQNWPAIMRQVLCKFHQELVADPIALVKNFIDTHAQGIIYQPSVAATADLAASLELLLHWDLRVLLVDLSMPIGYVFGGLDAIVPSRMLNVMQQQYPDLDYWLIQHAAHAPFLSHPTMMTAILKSWIKQ